MGQLDVVRKHASIDVSEASFTAWPHWRLFVTGQADPKGLRANRLLTAALAQVLSERVGAGASSMSSRTRPFFLSLGTVTGERVQVRLNGDPVEFDAPGFTGVGLNS